MSKVMVYKGVENHSRIVSLPCFIHTRHITPSRNTPNGWPNSISSSARCQETTSTMANHFC